MPAWPSATRRVPGSNDGSEAAAAMRLAMRDYAVIPLHHQMATWAMKKPLVYAPRTDEFTFAHHFHTQ